MTTGIAEKDTTRIWFFDNMKAILIFFVVFGHVLTSGTIPFLYQFIYLFHMPLFAFCSGYLAKVNPKKVLTNMVYPYMIFQILYCLFNKYYLGKKTEINFTKPVWIMWYMLVLIFWSLALPLIKVSIKTKIGMVITIICAFALGIGVGFVDEIGTFLSLSRAFYFLPFFVIGYCIKTAISAENFLKGMSKWYVRCISGLLTLGILGWLYLNSEVIEAKWLWAMKSYNKDGYDFTIRMLIYLATLIISIFIISIVPRRKTFFSYIGARCIQIYLLHGFVVNILQQNKVAGMFVEVTDKRWLPVYMVVISLVIVFVLSLKIWTIMFKPFLSFPFQKTEIKG